jgi:hypothetical protein
LVLAPFADARSSLPSPFQSPLVTATGPLGNPPGVT